VLLGIPDLRVEPDPWISIEDDRAKGLRLEETHPNASVDALVRAYWDMTPGTPPHLKERFAHHVAQGERRSEDLLAAEAGMAFDATGERWLDLGCGTGDLSVVGARHGASVTGLDVAFRWLVVARRRASSSRAMVRFVCGNAERLPFPSHTFTRAFALALLEHCRRPSDVLAEIRRVLRPGGAVVIRTVNRYSVLPEPHVGIRWVGYLPRGRADRFVHWRTGQRYLHHHPLSALELRRLMNDAGFSDVRVGPARLLEQDRLRLPAPLRALAGVYETGREMPLAKGLIGLIAPLLEAIGTAR
jgi:ubiquinone/menaquinone biosynthesis C-methylase UbiE